MTTSDSSRPTGGGTARPVRARPPAISAAFTALCTTVAVGLGVASAPAHAATIPHTATTSGKLAASALTNPAVQRVTLVTGEHIDVATRNGDTRYEIEGAAGGDGQLSTYQLPNGDRYYIPVEARPYLGRQLDLSLFDVSALSRAGVTGDARIPVNLSFAAGATPTAPPGVTLTSTTATTATGYLTAHSAAQFAAGLRAAIGADVRAGHKPGTGALFGGLVAMSAGGSISAAAKPAVVPHYPLHILQINATDLTGAPVSFAAALVLNTDLASSSNNNVPIVDGVARIAVPAGHYFAAALFAEYDSTGTPTGVYNVTLNDFAVAASGTTDISIAESSATSPFTVTTPRPSTQDESMITWNRQDATGATASFGSIVFGSGPTQYFNPQPAARVGKLHFVEQWGGAGPATGTPYRYDVAYGYDDIPAVQTHKVKPGELATVHHTFYADPAAQRGVSFLNGTGENNSTISGGTSYQGDVTQYLGAGDGGQWWQNAVTNGDGTMYAADLHTFAARHQYRIEWAHGPLAPNPGQHSGTQSFGCSACASSAGASFSFDTTGDSEPDHTGFPLGDSTATHYTLYVNGTVVADGDNLIGSDTGPATASGPTTYREVYDVDRTGNSDITQSTKTHTDLTVVYNPRRPGPVLPSDTNCDYGGIVTAPCHILPALNLNYHLYTDATTKSGAPLQTLLLNVGHLSYDGLGSHAAVTSVKVAVSFDGGKSWQPALVVGAAGTYIALWQNPRSAAGTSPSIKVSATDAVGGSITQTTLNAYTIAASAS